AATSAFFLWRSVLDRPSTDSDALRAALPARVVAEMARLADRYDWSQHESGGAPHAAALSAQRGDAVALYAARARCLERLNALRELGVDRVSLVLYGVPDQPKMVTRFVTDVAEQLR